MKQACIDAVANTLGRQPKADEIKNIEDRIKDAVRVIARRNAREGKTGIPDAETYRQAAELAAAQAVHAVFKKTSASGAECHRYRQSSRHAE